MNAFKAFGSKRGYVPRWRAMQTVLTGIVMGKGQYCVSLKLVDINTVKCTSV